MSLPGRADVVDLAITVGDDYPCALDDWCSMVGIAEHCEGWPQVRPQGRRIGERPGHDDHNAPLPPHEIDSP